MYCPTTPSESNCIPPRKHTTHTSDAQPWTEFPVSAVTTAQIIAPMLASLGLGAPMGAVLATLAIGSGAMVVSHANDSYFWVVTQFSDMDLDTAYKAQTVATLIQGVVAVLAIYGISLYVL